VKFENIIQFTDGCASQYKSKVPFFHISNYPNTERHFFGSGHGKGPSDACSGVVKASVTRTVRGGRIIANVNDLLKYGEEKLTRIRDKFYRTLHLVISEEVKCSISINSPKIVKGTRKLHSVKCITRCHMYQRINISMYLMLGDGSRKAM